MTMIVNVWRRTSASGQIRCLPVSFAALLAALLITPGAWAADSLPALHAAPDRTSVSGLSSGAFMAVQYSVAYSASVMGVGVVAGGPYNCAYLNLGGIVSCMQGAPSGDMSWVAAQGFAALGQIDPVAGISQLKVYVYGGRKDQVVVPMAVKATRGFYVAAGVKKRNLAYVSTVPSGHAFISPSYGNACNTNGAPYIDHCDVKGVHYDQPQAILSHVYGPLKPAVLTLSATVRPFDQREFAGAQTGLDSVGFYYAPKSCQKDASHCAVHVVFHGCEQGASKVGSDVYARVGYNQWADANGIIVLYPQVVATQAFPSNPQGCWDWWGYSGLNFQVKGGPQMRAVRDMIERVTAQP
jgi:poly(3-hydroxybutyrate) depolymerase